MILDNHLNCIKDYFKDQIKLAENSGKIDYPSEIGLFIEKFQEMLKEEEKEESNETLVNKIKNNIDVLTKEEIYDKLSSNNKKKSYLNLN